MYTVHRLRTLAGQSRNRSICLVEVRGTRNRPGTTVFHQEPLFRRSVERRFVRAVCVVDTREGDLRVLTGRVALDGHVNSDQPTGRSRSGRQP